MNWLTNYVKPKLEAVLQRKKETPENLWHKCKGCGQLIFAKEFNTNMFVCSSCDHHERIGPRDRFEQLFDGGEFKLIEVPASKDDPLKFKDQKKYTERLKESRKKTGDNDALLVAHGLMGGYNAMVASQNFFFMGGSMGVGVG